VLSLETRCDREGHCRTTFFAKAELPITNGVGPLNRGLALPVGYSPAVLPERRHEISRLERTLELSTVD